MKLSDINEDVTCSVARFHKEASPYFDNKYSPEVADYKSKNGDYYELYFKKWFQDDVAPVFTKPVVAPQAVYNNHPGPRKLQTAGYRGLQYALRAAGLPYNHDVQQYEEDPSRVIAVAAIDTVNSN